MVRGWEQRRGFRSSGRVVCPTHERGHCQADTQRQPLTQTCTLAHSPRLRAQQRSGDKTISNHEAGTWKRNTEQLCKNRYGEYKVRDQWIASVTLIRKTNKSQQTLSTTRGKCETMRHTLPGWSCGNSNSRFHHFAHYLGLFDRYDQFVWELQLVWEA
jgi:hypothetical protein